MIILMANECHAAPVKNHVKRHFVLQGGQFNGHSMSLPGQPHVKKDILSFGNGWYD